MKDDLFEDIILKFLDGDATANEKRMLSNWLREDPGREEIFFFHLSKRENDRPQYLENIDAKVAAYEKFLRGEKTELRPTIHDHLQEKQRHANAPAYGWWWAASVIVILSISFYMLNDTIFYKSYHSQEGAIRSVILEDGSKVTLNANSLIRVQRDFTGDENREVWIEGEAFFEITRKSDLRKFIVHTENLDVEVLGTKFNINNRRGKTEVTLDEGKVKLVSKDQKVLIMKPGEQVSLSENQGSFKKQVVTPEKAKAWRANKLVFDNTPLAEVSQIIQDYYGLEVILEDSVLASRHFTGTLPNDDLDVILMALSTAYNIEIEHDDEYIILK